VKKLGVVLMLAAVPILSSSSGKLAAAGANKESKQWTERFDTSACRWSSTGRNDFFILEPGYRQVLDGREGKDRTHLEITVLNETKTLGGVETRVVEERESKNGQLAEISRNFYAVCGPGNDVFYFGEETDTYESGKVSGHEGAWAAGKGGAKAGLFMPARPLLGARFYQEVAPGAAMDRVEVVSDSESVKTPAGSFQDCVKIEETTPLEPHAKEYKIFARGIGTVQDEDLLLTKYGTVGAQKP